MKEKEIVIRSIGEKISLTIVAILISGFTLACIYPFLLVLGSSFTKETNIFIDGYRIIPKVFSTEAYQVIMQGNSPILHGYLVSLAVTILGTGGSLLVNLLMGYALSRETFRGRRFFNIYVIITLLFNAGLISWYMVCVNVWHLPGRFEALVLPSLANGFFVMLIRNLFSTVPREVIESAKVDGATEFRMAFSVVFPMSIPVIFTVALMAANNYWNDWFLALMFMDNNAKLYPIQYVLRSMVANSQYIVSMTQNGVSNLGSTQIPTEGVKMAAGVMAIGPVILVYPFIQRYFIRGLTIGAIKG